MTEIWLSATLHWSREPQEKCRAAEGCKIKTGREEVEKVMA